MYPLADKRLKPGLKSACRDGRRLDPTQTRIMGRRARLMGRCARPACHESLVCLAPRAAALPMGSYESEGKAHPKLGFLHVCAGSELVVRANALVKGPLTGRSGCRHCPNEWLPAMTRMGTRALCSPMDHAGSSGPAGSSQGVDASASTVRSRPHLSPSRALSLSRSPSPGRFRPRLRPAPRTHRRPSSYASSTVSGRTSAKRPCEPTASWPSRLGTARWHARTTQRR
jgi:hypothetical protein